MDKRVKEDQETGVRLASRITDALVASTLLAPGFAFNDVAHVIYGECLAIARDQKIGDWLEMPNGTTYVMVFRTYRSQKEGD
jgi:hypothetical protein